MNEHVYSMFVLDLKRANIAKFSNVLGHSEVDEICFAIVKVGQEKDVHLIW